MKNVLITGGAGFIGSALALRLQSKGYRVTVMDNLSPQVHGSDPEQTSPLYKSILGKVNFIHGSVTCEVDWLEALKDQHYIIHLAAETGTGQSMYEIAKYVNTNIMGTSILLDLLANTPHKVQRVLVAESRAIYGEGRYYSEERGSFVYPGARKEQDLKRKDFEVRYPGCRNPLELTGTTEASKIHPTSVYGITKQVQGQLVHVVCKSLGIESVSFRYQNVYGPGQSLSNPYTGILSIFSTRIKNNKEITIFEDGKESRDFIYIDDVITATIRGLEVEEASGYAFNVGTGVATDVLTVSKLLMEKYGLDVPIRISGNFRLGDIRHNYADITLAREVLGFEPKWSFSEGIGEFVQWVNSQEVHQDKYDKSLSEMKRRGLFK